MTLTNRLNQSEDNLNQLNARTNKDNELNRKCSFDTDIWLHIVWSALKQTLRSIHCREALPLQPFSTPLPKQSILSGC